MAMYTRDFDFDLPPELIAQFPPERRGASRLLHAMPNENLLADKQFSDLCQEIRPGDVMVFNDTRVIKARLHGQKESGGHVELLIERTLGEQDALCFIRASHAPKAGSNIHVADVVLQVVAREADLYHVHIDGDILDFLEQHGKLPLPPYIERAPQTDDEARYQTVYAHHPGAVAAPTAGLHFDEQMLQALDAKGVVRVNLTLHIGAGTFQPVRVDDISQHVMHSEHYRISTHAAETINLARQENRRIIAVGTTSLRALEAAAQNGRVMAGDNETSIFITPGYRFQIVDRLLTNFHLPKSTLFMLVSAFAGTAFMHRAYAHAIAQRYRFFSYGDAMLIECATNSTTGSTTGSTTHCATNHTPPRIP